MNMVMQQQMFGAYNPNAYYYPYNQQHIHYLNGIQAWSTTQPIMPNQFGYAFQPGQVNF